MSCVSAAVVVSGWLHMLILVVLCAFLFHNAHMLSDYCVVIVWLFILCCLLGVCVLCDGCVCVCFGRLLCAHVLC